MEIKGKVIAIMPEQVISDKFKKREFVVETSDNYPQKIKMQFVNDKCYLGEKLIIGGEVTAYINLKGREYTKKDGGIDYILSAECWKITVFSEEAKKEDDLML
jgi:single-strand DNA-binding protein